MSVITQSRRDKIDSPRDSPVLRFGVTAAMVLNAAISLVFVNRTQFDLDGQRAYTLFDDAMISMRYARNFAEGNGLVWNQGEQVEGYTNFLWTLYMSVLHLLPVPDRLMPAVVAYSGAVLLVLGVWLAAKLTRMIAPHLTYAPVMAAFLTATAYPLMYWTLRGMEVGFISVLTTAACILVLRHRETGSQKALLGAAGLLGAGVLTRPDAVIIAAVVGVCAIATVSSVHRKRVALVIVGVPLAIFIAHTAFRLGYYGEIVPNTYTLKVSHVPLDVRLERGLAALGALLFKGGALVLLFAAGAAVVSLWKSRALLAMPVLLVAAFLAYSVYVGGDAWENLKFANRYVSTVLPLLFVLGAVGVESMLRERRVLPIALMSVGVVATLLASLPDLAPIDSLYQPWTSTGAPFVIGVIAVLVVSLVAFAVMRIGNGRPIAICMMVVSIGLVAMTSGKGLSEWWQWMAPLEAGDRDTARYGVALKEMTEPGTRIALSSAGNIAYFAGDDRVFIDELGKMDPAIAQGEPRRADFPPGHQKWNYDYTFHTLQPDLISQSFGLTAKEVAKLMSSGWIPVNDDAFVRPGADNVDAEAVREFHEDVKRGWARG